MRVSILDYGVGNLHSLAKAFTRLGAEVTITPEVAPALDADAIVLPGVGAFDPAARQLAPGRDALRDAVAGGMPVLGICLGMQLLFSESDEGSDAGGGLGIIPGRVERLRATRVPQIGWNVLDDVTDPLVTRSRLTTAYYANSYVCRPSAPQVVTAWSTHERARFPAAVRAGSVVGVQFHPEKSSAPGLRYLGEFLNEVRAKAVRV